MHKGIALLILALLEKAIKIDGLTES